MNRKHRDGHRTHVGGKDRYAAAMKDALVARTKKLELEMKSKRGGDKNMLNALRNYTTDRQYDLEDCMALLAFAAGMKDQYLQLSMDAPAWIDDRVKSIRRTVKTMVSDEQERKLSELKARRAAIATPDEKRSKLDEAIAALEKQVAGG